MITAKFSTQIAASPEKIWAELIDYEGYSKLPKIQSAKVTKKGNDHPAGLGAIREIKVDGITFVEEIVEFEQNRTLGYKIIACKPLPFEHDFGRMTLSEQGNVTHVNWETRFRIPIPLVGGVITRLIKIPMGRTFQGILDAFKARMEKSA